MAIWESRRVRISKYLLLAGICVTFQAFIMKPEAKLKKAGYNAELLKYFEAPQLPEKFCNAEPRKVQKKNKNKKNSKRISSTKVERAIVIASIMNPVLGATRQSIISVYGDARDGGRKHQGIDIVAPKGTMVIAPSEGEIVEVGYNSLGGKVIWMKDHKLKRSYYFAHLDSQIVKKGTMVKPGDTLGTVGNTGNARRTRAHLHFGVYKKDGRTPVDYLRTKAQVYSMLISAE